MNAIKQAQARAQSWLFEAAAPLWSKNAVLNDGMFAEKLDAQGQIAPAKNRFRVQARQIYSFCEIGRLGWSGDWRTPVEAALVPFLAHGRTERGHFVHMFDEEGAVCDTRPDLYNLAFGLLALAYAGRALGRPELFALAVEIRTNVLNKWERPEGGYWEGEVTPCPPHRQNPHMHLLEASLALYSCTQDKAWFDIAKNIITLFKTHLQDSVSGAVKEYFDAHWQPFAGAQGEIVEPGHCFEWSWLLEVAPQELRDVAASEALLGFARVHGICAERGVAINQMDAQGGVLDANARLWPQTERIKSAVVRYKRTAAPQDGAEIVAAFAGLERYFTTDISGLWYDTIDAHGAALQEPSPASSFYHIVCALSELIRLEV
jgi:mannose/cellobiose epimerase-like protein (N-acyl-D-glucosamine 2-epimerase family)